MSGLVVNPADKVQAKKGMDGIELGALLATAVAAVTGGKPSDCLKIWTAVGTTIVNYIHTNAVVNEGSTFRGYATPANADYEQQLMPAKVPYNAISKRAIPAGTPDAPLPMGDYFNVAVSQTVTGSIL